jgi:8-oxo-dGTP pyrophosphatase MutT (NUDIX family)
MKTVHSYGIIAYKKSQRGTEIILIRRPYTYAYRDFITSHYQRNNVIALTTVLSGTTYEEKRLIQTGEFPLMWNKMLPCTDKNYKKHMQHYMALYGENNNILLRAVKKSRVGLDIWEIPKGRKNKDESDIDAAIREFCEETDLMPSQIHLELDRKPYKYSYTGSNGICYSMTYYYAVVNDTAVPQINFSNELQVKEISAVKFCTKMDLPNLVDGEHLERLTKLFENVCSSNRRVRRLRMARYF